MGAISVHQNGSGAGGEGAATTHGSSAFVKKRPARLPVTAAPARLLLTGSAAGLAIVRPSTARCARAQDEESSSMPSAVHLLSSAEGSLRACRRTHVAAATIVGRVSLTTERTSFRGAAQRRARNP